MDLRHLNYFLALADELHFGRAAARLHISQPPLTRMIKQIEAELGVDLFERSKRSVRLTPAGESLLQDARQILQQMDTVKKRLAIQGRGGTGTIRIGYVGAVMHSPLPPLLAKFSKSHPGIRLQFEEMPNQALLQGLHQGTLDAAFVRTRPPATNLQEKILLEEPFVAVLPAGHPLAGKKQLSVKQLRDEDFITFTRDCGPTLYDNFLLLCSRAGFTPQIRHQASQLNSVLRLVESGFGVSLLPAAIGAGYDLRLHYLPLEYSRVTVPLIMLNRKEQVNPALTLLQRHLEKMEMQVSGPEKAKRKKKKD